MLEPIEKMTRLATKKKKEKRAKRKDKCTSPNMLKEKQWYWDMILKIKNKKMEAWRKSSGKEIHMRYSN